MKTNTTRPVYSCFGPVRGDCGVNHRSHRTATACCARDHAGCNSQGGYSDRVAYNFGGASEVPDSLGAWTRLVVGTDQDWAQAE